MALRAARKKTSDPVGKRQKRQTPPAIGQHSRSFQQAKPKHSRFVSLGKICGQVIAFRDVTVILVVFRITCAHVVRHPSS